MNGRREEGRGCQRQGVEGRGGEERGGERRGMGVGDTGGTQRSFQPIPWGILWCFGIMITVQS